MRKDSAPRSSSSTDDRIVVGRIGRPHGVRGEVTVVPLTDAPDRFSPGSRLVTDDPDPRHLVIAATRRHKRGGLIVAFEEVRDRSGAEALRSRLLTIPAGERRTLEADEFWPEDLEGLEVRTPSGELLGRVVEVVIGAAQDRLVLALREGDRTVEVPFVPELVTEVCADEGYLVVEPLEGLL